MSRETYLQRFPPETQNVLREYANLYDSFRKALAGIDSISSQYVPNYKKDLFFGGIEIELIINCRVLAGFFPDINEIDVGIIGAITNQAITVDSFKNNFSSNMGFFDDPVVLKGLVQFDNRDWITTKKLPALANQYFTLIDLLYQIFIVAKENSTYNKNGDICSNRINHRARKFLDEYRLKLVNIINDKDSKVKEPIVFIPFDKQETPSNSASIINTEEDSDMNETYSFTSQVSYQTTDNPLLLLFNTSEQKAAYTFKEILIAYPDCFSDQKRFEGLLRDYFMNDALFVNLLCAANTMHIAEEIQDAPSITNVLIYRHTKKLEEQGYNKENAGLAVRMWCVCYGNLILGKSLELDPAVIVVPTDDTIQLSDICGQKNNIKLIRSMIEAAKLRNEPLGSILICGPANSGKNTLACAIANEATNQKRIIRSERSTKPGDLAGVFTNMNANDGLIMHDIQKLSPDCIDSVICPTVETHSVIITIGKGITAREINLDLQPFMFIATAPDKNAVPDALLNCFDLVCEMEPYTTEDICEYIQMIVSCCHLSVSTDAIRYIAEHCNQKFIRANKLIMRLRDFAQVENVTEVTLPYVQNKLSFVL